MSPIIATKIADSIGCTLPTRKMVNDIYAQAALKLAPLTIPASGTMTTVQAFAQHNGMVYSQRSASLTAYPLGTLTGGDKKDVVISNADLCYGKPRGHLWLAYQCGEPHTAFEQCACRYLYGL